MRVVLPEPLAPIRTLKRPGSSQVIRSLALARRPLTDTRLKYTPTPQEAQTFDDTSSLTTLAARSEDRLRCAVRARPVLGVGELGMLDTESASAADCGG